MVCCWCTMLLPHYHMFRCHCCLFSCSRSLERTVYREFNKKNKKYSVPLLSFLAALWIIVVHCKLSPAPTDQSLFGLQSESVWIPQLPQQQLLRRKTLKSGRVLISRKTKKSVNRHNFGVDLQLFVIVQILLKSWVKKNVLLYFYAI